MGVFTAASRSSVAFAVISLALSATLAFSVSGAVAAAYTIAYAATAALTFDALTLGSSRARFTFFFLRLQMNFCRQYVANVFFNACYSHPFLWSCILVAGTAVGACASPLVNYRVLFMLLSVVLGASLRTHFFSVCYARS